MWQDACFGNCSIAFLYRVQAPVSNQSPPANAFPSSKARLLPCPQSHHAAWPKPKYTD